MQAGGIGEQRRLCHCVLVSSRHFSGMREKYQHLIEMVRNIAKWLMLGTRTHVPHHFA